MDLIVTKNLEEITRAWLDGKRRVFMEGGTWSSKTYSAIQFLHNLLSQTKRPLLASVVSETMPHLKRGAILDFTNILGDEFSDARWNKSDFHYDYPETKSKLEFFSADQPSKLRGARRQILFGNEFNNVPYDSYWELDIRTELFTICDWNPTSEFWFHEERLLEKQVSEEEWVSDPDNVYVHSTYLDALNVIPANKREEIEATKFKDPNRWEVYGLGLLGKITGLVYPKFEQVDQLPEGDVFYGLDFGYQVDPTVLVKNVIVGDKLYSQQVFYADPINRIGLDNNQIGMEMTRCGIRGEPIFADPDEEKSIDELRALGFNMGETIKGKGSVEFRRQRVNQFFQHWTKDSLECIKEQRNFRYIKKREPNSGREYLSDDTTHQWSHGMSAREFGVASYKQVFRGILKPVSNH